MATWKKVHVNGANTTHGTITANLGAAGNDIDDTNLSHNIVVSATDGTSEGALTVAEVTFGTAAFDAATSFATAAQGTLAGTAVQPGDFLKDLVTNNGLTGGVNDILYGSDGDVTIGLAAIDNLRVLGNVSGSSAAPTAVTINDTDAFTDASATTLATSESIKAYVDAQVLASGSGTVTSVDVIGGTNITDTGSAVTTSGSFTLNLDTTLEDMIGLNFANSSATGIGVDASTGENAAGAGLNIHAGQGTGTGAGGSITFQVADGGTSGSSANALATALTIADDKTVTAAGNVVVTGDLTVNGSTTTVSTTNLLVEDVFIRLAAEASADADTGIIFGGSAQKVFGWDNGTESGRFGVAYSGGDAAETDGFADGEDFDGYMSVVHSADGAAAQVSAFGQLGNIYVDTATDDIYIYS